MYLIGFLYSIVFVIFQFLVKEIEILESYIVKGYIIKKKSQDLNLVLGVFKIYFFFSWDDWVLEGEIDILCK